MYAGAGCLLRALDAPRRAGPALLGAVVCLGLAVFTKQQTWAFVVAGVAYAFWRPATRPLAWKLALGLACLCAAGLACAQYASQGQFLRQTFEFPRLMAQLSGSNSFAAMFGRIGELVAMHGVLVAVFVWAVSVRRFRPFGLLDALFWAGLVSTAMSLRWWGASVNHFMGLLVLVLVEAAVYLSGQARAGRLWELALVLTLLVPLRFGANVPSGAGPVQRCA